MILPILWLFFLPPPTDRQADALALVQFMPREATTPYCQSLGLAEQHIVACTRGGEMFLPNPCQWPARESYAELACHELGHVRGWIHDAAGNDISEPPPEDPPT